MFPAQGGPATSYIGTNFNNGTGTSTLSNWLLTPADDVAKRSDLDLLDSHGRLAGVPGSVAGAHEHQRCEHQRGTTSTSVGDFTTLLLDINPTYTLAGYPNVWTQFTRDVEWHRVTDARSSGVTLLCGERWTERRELRLHRHRHVIGCWNLRPDADARNTNTVANTRNTDPNSGVTPTPTPCAGGVALSENFDWCDATAAACGLGRSQCRQS